MILYLLRKLWFIVLTLANPRPIIYIIIKRKRSVTVPESDIIICFSAGKETRSLLCLQFNQVRKQILTV